LGIYEKKLFSYKSDRYTYFSFIVRNQTVIFLHNFVISHEKTSKNDKFSTANFPLKNCIFAKNI